RGVDVARHISFGIFSTLITLLGHSMMMFYLIGKGKAVKDAMAEHSLTGDYFRRIALARKPVFSIATLAMAVTMITAILGAPAADRPPPARVRRRPLQSRRAQDRDRRAFRVEPHRRRSEPPPRRVTPILELAGVAKGYGALRPLRIRGLVVAEGESVALVGLDRPAAEVLVNLITGTTLPDEGRIAAFRRSTAEIRDGADWLTVVDRFGIVSERAVLLEPLSTLQNMAMPFTLEIEPIAPDARDRAAALAREVGVPESLWQTAVASL